MKSDIREADLSMTEQEVYDWVNERYQRDPEWAYTEERVRQAAVEAQRNLTLSSRYGETSIGLMRPDPHAPFGRSYAIIRLRRMPRLGGAEELLAFEEIIRRALGGRT